MTWPSIGSALGSIRIKPSIGKVVRRIDFRYFHLRCKPQNNAHLMENGSRACVQIAGRKTVALEAG
jgi:hypothetical protein